MPVLPNSGLQIEMVPYNLIFQMNNLGLSDSCKIIITINSYELFMISRLTLVSHVAKQSRTRNTTVCYINE